MFYCALATQISQAGWTDACYLSVLLVLSVLLLRGESSLRVIMGLENWDAREACRSAGVSRWQLITLADFAAGVKDHAQWACCLAFRVPVLQAEGHATTAEHFLKKIHGLLCTGSHMSCWKLE